VYLERIKLKRFRNGRDLGGMPAGDKFIRPGRLIRCGKLYKLPKDTKRYLESVNVTTVIDLRIETERNEYPDTKIEGSRYILCPLLCTPTPGITTDRTMLQTMLKEGERINSEYGTADNYMKEMYLNVLFNPETREALIKFMRLIRDGEGCILYHCSSGKDRAGLCSMLIEALLGVDEETILSDYMLSRRFCRRKFFFNRLGLALVPVIAKRHRNLKKVLFGLMRLKKEYMGNVIAELKRRYGSIEGYCREALGVTDSDIALLKEKYLTDRVEEKI